MDPIAVLQSRIEQLEAKLGLAANAVPDSQQGDTAAQQTLNPQAVNNVTVGQDKLHGAMHMANELNNYTEPIFNDMSEQNNKHMQDVSAAEPILHHCQCTHHYKQTAPVPGPEPILQAPETQATAEGMHSTTAELKAEADARPPSSPLPDESVSTSSCTSPGIAIAAEALQGMQEAGAGAAGAFEQAAAPAQHVELAEQKSVPRRRNGLD